LKDPTAARRVEVVGTLARLDVDGHAMVRDIDQNADWKTKTANCSYDQGLQPRLLENFGKRVRIALIQQKVGAHWSTQDPELVDIERFEAPAVKP
jgi:hypothetical protein